MKHYKTLFHFRLPDTVDLPRVLLLTLGSLPVPCTLLPLSGDDYKDVRTRRMNGPWTDPICVRDVGTETPKKGPLLD